MGRTPIDELVHIIDSEAKYITKLPQRIDPSMTEAVMKWKSLVAKACVSLVLKLASDSSDTTAEPPSSDYMIDLRAGINILPQRFDSLRKPIGEETKFFRTQHEEKIKQKQI
ncbi:unnamed protein product [Adineta steineri]|uniref:Uncharacterized protein n=1 Tax=Adineta steineri TaxID=433720 RepID=A0A819WI96_9BILA|nr:unnamed protein product [Adineta steineri]